MKDRNNTNRDEELMSKVREVKKSLADIDSESIDKLLNRGCCVLSVIPDGADSKRCFFNAIARRIAEIADIEPLEYTPENVRHFRKAMVKHVWKAIEYKYVLRPFLYNEY